MLSRALSAGTKVKEASRTRTASEENTGSLCEHTSCMIMANDQDKVGQQGGTAQNNPGNFANDREKASEAGQKGGQMCGGRSEDQQTGQGSGGNLLDVPVIEAKVAVTEDYRWQQI